MSNKPHLNFSLSQETIEDKKAEICSTLPDLSDNPLDYLVTAIALESIAADLRVKAACFKVNPLFQSLGTDGDKDQPQIERK